MPFSCLRLLPIFIISDPLAFAFFGDSSRATVLATSIFHVVHALFLLAVLLGRA